MLSIGTGAAGERFPAIDILPDSLMLRASYHSNGVDGEVVKRSALAQR